MIIAAMPAHNEDERIAKVVLGAKKHVDKVVVVDDGSTDSNFFSKEKTLTKREVV
jgi:glycosyltransferase involved in cell wall biosynthesis